MRSTVIDCAGCGAPLGEALGRLGASELVPCLYCGALLRFSAGSAAVAPAVERRIDAELVARAREAALRGGRDEAIAVCLAEGIGQAGAAAAVDDLLRHVAHRTVFSQTLSGVGWLLVAGGLALAAAGLTCLSHPEGSAALGLVLLTVAGAHLSILARGIATSRRFLVAARGVALIRRAIDVGPTGFSDGCHVVSLAVDVTPDGGGAPFHARLVVPVRPASLERMQAGKRLGVRFGDGGAWLRADGDRAVG
jgi:ribosomal protein S27E